MQQCSIDADGKDWERRREGAALFRVGGGGGVEAEGGEGTCFSATAKPCSVVTTLSLRIKRSGR